jgi:uncharacterized protein (DUF1684 family)
MKPHRRTFSDVLYSLLLLVTPIVCAVAQQSTSEAEAYNAEIQAWHDKRLANLKQPVGWLSLVALDWLQEGKNPIDSIGTITLEKGILTFEAFPGVRAAVGGNSFPAGILRAGVERVEIGSRVFTIIKRGDRFAVRMWDGESVRLRTFTGIERFAVSKQWKIEARWEPYVPAKPIKVPSVIPGYLEDYKVPGVAVFSIEGKECRLEPVESGPTSLFYIFADQTNGQETYGAGRFLYSDPPKDGKVVIDFNKAINPPCAFTDYATCPLPPESNHLSVRVEAGEKKFGEH